jgi:hypothetical protein
MKILHCCLANFYIDNFGYQENILTKMHKLQGHDVEIVASTETYLDEKKLGYVKPSNYINEYGIKVTRLPYINFLPHLISKKLRIYKGLSGTIRDFQPDIIFLHGVQFLSVHAIKRYVAKHKNVKIFADGHADFINSARNWLSKNILHKVIYRHCAQVLVPFTEKFFGVTPLRVEFFKDVYKVPKDKVDLLVLGVDDSALDLKNRLKIREEIREKLGLENNDVVIITGGKIDERKNIHNLMRVVGVDFDARVKLLVFGEPTNEMADLIGKLFQAPNIIKLGWLAPDDIYDYLYAADFAFFPGTHSVLWEQCVGIGLPCVFRRWRGMEHVDVGGNCIFLESGDEQEIKSVIDRILDKDGVFSSLKKSASLNGPSKFLYSEIAKKAIGQS